MIFGQVRQLHSLELAVMKIKKMKEINFILFLIIGLISCSGSNEFYNKEQRLKMREHEPNILFTNYHVLECEKYVTLKVKSVDEIAKAEIELNFLAGSKFMFNNKSSIISNIMEEITFDSDTNNDLEENLNFRINDAIFTFPDVKPIKVTNEENIKELEIGTILHWEPSGENENILIAIKPGHKYCGKKGVKGQTYGTRPMLVPDTGEYIVESKDLELFDSGMEIGVMFKRGKNIVTEINSNNGGKDKICISSVSFANYNSKIK